ncbi:MAG: hypothetical protein IPK83_24945 [Planctomycetes bacterium]|nr:hypothetical protein [Planctomycetota bacterium]
MVAEAFQKIRYEPKDFLQRWPDGRGGWLWKRPGNAPYFLYRSPNSRQPLPKAEPSSSAREKRTLIVWRLLAVATSNVEGASKPEQRAKWKAEYTTQLTGAARVILLPDNDEQGRAHMRHVAEQLRGKVADIRSLELPGPPDKGDVSDWLDAGGTVDELGNDWRAKPRSRCHLKPRSRRRLKPRSRCPSEATAENSSAHLRAQGK